MGFWDTINPLKIPSKIKHRVQDKGKWYDPIGVLDKAGGIGRRLGLGGSPGMPTPGGLESPSMGGLSRMPMPGGAPGMPSRPMPGGAPGMPMPGGIGRRLTNDPMGDGGGKGTLGRLGGWIGENPELATGIAGAAASTYGAYKQGQARDAEVEQRRREVEWEQQQEEERQRRKEEAMEEMQAQWEEWGWV